MYRRPVDSLPDIVVMQGGAFFERFPVRTPKIFCVVVAEIVLKSFVYELMHDAACSCIRVAASHAVACAIN